MPQRDQLFLLLPGFEDNNRREYCPECAELWGLLSWYPFLKDTVDFHFQPIQKPRPQMVALLGEGFQNCPTLLLDKSSPYIENTGIHKVNDLRFIDNARSIGVYYAHRFGLPFPRGVPM